MAEDIFISGKFTDLANARQLHHLNELLVQILNRLNQIDPGGVALSWLEGAAAGQVIASAGVGNSPVWSGTPTLTGVTLSGLTASQVVVTDGSKALASEGPLTVAKGGTGAATLTDNGVLYGNTTAAVAATAEGATGTVLAGSTGSPPSFTASPTLTGATLTGLTASQMVQTDASKVLISVAPTGTYTVTNHTDDRALNETGDTLVQVANVLGTLINDLKTQKVIG